MCGQCFDVCYKHYLSFASLSTVHLGHGRGRGEEEEEGEGEGGRDAEVVTVNTVNRTMYSSHAFTMMLLCFLFFVLFSFYFTSAK